MALLEVVNVEFDINGLNVVSLQLPILQRRIPKILLNIKTIL